MPLINDPSNTRSNFPFSLDTLTLFSNGTGVSSTINAETWNILESVIYRLETHVQKTPLYFDAADRKRVCLSGTTTVTAGFLQIQLTLVTTFAQLNFLNGNLQSTGSMFFADVIHLDGNDDCTTDIQITQSNITVYIQRTDPTQTLSGGTYLVNLTILGY